jgi:hypothetical protein
MRDEPAALSPGANTRLPTAPVTGLRTTTFRCVAEAAPGSVF